MFGKRRKVSENQNEVQAQSVTDVPSDENYSTETPRSTAEEAVPGVQKPRRHTGIFVVLLLLLVGLAASVGFMLSQSHDASAPSLPATSSTKEQHAAQPISKTMPSASVIAAVTKAVGGTTDTSDKYGSSVPYRKLDGYSYTTLPNADHHVTFLRTSTEYGSTHKTAEQALIGQGLTGSLAPALSDYDGASSTPEKWFTGTNLWCTLSGIAATDYVVTVACTDDVSYQQTAEEQKPLYAAYVNGATTPITDGSLLLSKPVFRQSPHADYQTAEVGTSQTNSAGGYVASYYQTPDKIWHWFGGNQQMFMCSDFKTADQKKAYQGTSCMLGDANSTVSKVQ